MLEALFKPSTVAVIGAAREPGKVGYELLRNIAKSGFLGKLFPVNPKADEIQGTKCYPSVLEVPSELELAIITVPAAVVSKVAEECGKKGVKVLVVISAGFREVGPEGLKLEMDLIRICVNYGMKLVGPNCLGVIDTSTPLNASFSASMPIRGNVAFISQSGAICTAVLDWALMEGFGFSKFISLGNKAGLDESEFISALAEDEATRCILLYVEGIDKGEKFVKIAKESLIRKPIIVLKSGISNAGKRAVSSHTGSMAGSETAYHAAFKRTNIIRVQTIEEMFDVAKAFSTQPMPLGPNVAIVTNAGGPGILATDACERYGLNLSDLDIDALNLLRQKLPSAASFHNPVDILGDANADRYSYAVRILLMKDYVHAVIVIFTPQAMSEPDRTAEYVAALRNELQEGHDKPMIAAFLGGESIKKAERILWGARIPNYSSPERAVLSIAKMIDYAGYVRTASEEMPPRFYVDQAKAKTIIEQVRMSGRVNPLGIEALSVMAAYGMRVPSYRLVKTAEEAVVAASQVGYPVVLKVSSPHIVHKTDVGGVKLNLLTPEEVKNGFYEVTENVRRFMPYADVSGVEVYNMVPPGKEVIIGANKDPQFGMLLMFGLGGVYINFLKDVSFRLAPLTRKEALEMISETKTYVLLRGVRGEPPSDVDAIVDALLRVSQLVNDFKEISELDINPLFVYERGKGCLALDAKITISPRVEEHA